MPTPPADPSMSASSSGGLSSALTRLKGPPAPVCSSCSSPITPLPLPPDRDSKHYCYIHKLFYLNKTNGRPFTHTHTSTCTHTHPIPPCFPTPMATSNPAVLIVTYERRLHVKAHPSQPMAAAHKPGHKLSCPRPSSHSPRDGAGRRTGYPKAPRSSVASPLSTHTGWTHCLLPVASGALQTSQPVCTSADSAARLEHPPWGPGVGIVWFREEQGTAVEHQIP